MQVNKDPSKTSTHTGYDIFRGKRDSAWGWSKLVCVCVCVCVGLWVCGWVGVSVCVCVPVSVCLAVEARQRMGVVQAGVCVSACLRVCVCVPKLGIHALFACTY